MVKWNLNIEILKPWVFKEIWVFDITVDHFIFRVEEGSLGLLSLIL